MSGQNLARSAMRLVHGSVLVAGMLVAMTTGSAPASAQEATAATATALPDDRQEIVVIVRNVRTDKGKVRIALWDRPEKFTKSKHSVVGEKMDAARGEVRFVIPDMPTGHYAAAVYHDENDNGEMDRTWIGLPDEGLGFSNGAKIHYDILDPGPPTFEEARVAIDDDNREIVVELDY